MRTVERGVPDWWELKDPTVTKPMVCLERSDLELLCDWLSYYGAMDTYMSEWYEDTVGRLRKDHNLRAARLVAR